MARPSQTSLYSRTIPGGVRVIADLMQTGSGNIYWVDSVNGSSTNSGNGPDDALVTWDAAINKCTANQGDTIVLMENHQEDITAAGGVDLDVAGVKTIGLGDGAQMPEIKLTTAATADVDIDAADNTIENVHFKSGYADINHCIDVNATGATIKGCKFTEDDDDENFLICVLGATSTTSSGLTVEDCYCLQDDASNTHFVSLPGTSKGDIIRNNTILGDFGTAAIGSAGVSTFLTVVDNLISNAATDNDAAINLHSSATGIVMRNLAGGGAAQANGVTATAAAVAENYYGVVSEDLSAILDPIAT